MQLGIILQLSEASPISVYLAQNHLQGQPSPRRMASRTREAPSSDHGDLLTYLYQLFPMMLTGRLCQIRALTQHDQMTCLGPLVERDFQMSIKLSTFAALIKRGKKKTRTEQLCMSCLAAVPVELVWLQ